jgi:hypothetical protein
MAVSGRLDIRHSIDAAVDLSDNQYRLVWFDANGKAVVATAGGPGLILVDKPEAGQGGTVILVGKSKVKLGAACDAGDTLTPGSTGLAVPATGSDTPVAIALEAGVQNQIVTCLVAAFVGNIASNG